ncbi:MAG TPA: GspH/FimT family pseudopilin, partial [Usitatibacteraceae bacterium]|nr:GspH/FimT family pseudopilin [Usitatibacteraceae bacterium]
DARGQAIASQESVALAVDLDKRTIEVSGAGQPRELPERLEIQLYTAQSEVASERKGAIRFYPDGSSTGGRVTLAAGERRLLVDVDWLTGRVSIKEGG